jgi:molybdenum cofactor cytidylyltransferase
MSPDSSRLRFALGVILLAAGASSRMGKPKLLLPWRSTSVLGHHLRVWRQLGAEQIAVVCAPEPHPVHHELDRLGFPATQRVINPQPERGMLSSIRCAAGWSGWKPLSHWAILLGDQPHIPVEVLARLLEFAANNPGQVSQPAYHGRARHPVILPRTALQDLAISTAANLNQYLRSLTCGTALCDLDHPALDLDLDTPAEYEQALREYGGSPADSG